jgi:hypothetical protein
MILDRATWRLPIMPKGDDLTDLAGDIVALRIATQRLFAIIAAQLLEKGNAWLDSERVELLSILNRWSITSPDMIEAGIKARAEYRLNELFDQIRIGPLV